MKTNIKYRDLPSEIQNTVYSAYGQIAKSNNPTVKHILKKIKMFEEQYEKEGAYNAAKRRREAINKIEAYLIKGV